MERKSNGMPSVGQESTRHRLVFFAFFTLFPPPHLLFMLIQLFHERVSSI